MNAHIFRRDGANHTVVTVRNKVRRNSKHHTLCGKRVDDSFQRRAPFGLADPRQDVVTCEVCAAGLTALVDVLETDYGFASRDDGTGRFT